MTDRVLCRYYMHGACKYGEGCRFSHDLSTAPSQVCKYYNQGYCAFGDKCRYEHVRPEWCKKSKTTANNNYSPPQLPKPAPDAVGSTSFDTPRNGVSTVQEESAAIANTSQDFGNENTEPNDPYASSWVDDGPFVDEAEAAYHAQENAFGPHTSSCWQGHTTGMSNINKPLCTQYQVSGYCTRGSNCPLIHGSQCELCKKYALHPYDKKAVADHKKECKERHARLQAHSVSADIKCSICLDKVLGKEKPAQRRFGLLSCSHPFCLECIRSWRSKQDGQLDVGQAVRTCPVCRTPSHFVTPSPLWPSDPEQKEQIVSSYKNKLLTIDCKYYNFGDGNCPFGTSCFYRHVDRDGRPEEVVLRKAGNAEGEVEVLQPVRLSMFLDNDQAARLLRTTHRR